MKETGKALNYIAKIRNKEKQRYAQAYYEYCENIRFDDPTLSSTYGCNYMAKQAVRLELAFFGICEKNRPSASYWPQ